MARTAGDKKNSNMFHELSKFENVQIGEIKQQFASVGRKRLAQVTLADLTVHLNSFGGIYIFYSEGECFYVGKTSSRSFVERIAGHFDSRECAYMNHFLKKLVKHKICQNLRSAIDFALNCEICLFTFSSDDALRANHKVVEDFLRTVWLPKLNARKGHYDESKLAGDYLHQI